MLYAYTENFVLPLSHDEVVHGKGSLFGKMPGDHWQKRANLRLLYTYMYTYPGKKLLFMGSEFAQYNEWDCNRQLDWWLLDFPEHRQIKDCVAALNRLYRSEPALYQLDFEPAGFRWVDFSDADGGVISYLRKGHQDEDTVLVVLNLTPVPRPDYRIGAPRPGFYREIFNSDSTLYGGGNLGNLGGRHTDAIPMHGFRQSLNLMLPPLAAVILKPQT